jgi:hypothetical protein
LADAIQPQPAACDGIDHGTTPSRLEQLQKEGHAFNQLLRVNEVDAHGKNHATQVSEANKAFYDLLPSTQTTTDTSDDGSNEGRAFHASKSLYEQATQLPVGERKALLKATMEENAALSATDHALPVMTLSMDSDSFLNSLDVAYPVPIGAEKNGKTQSYGTGEVFTFSYMGGQCTEWKTPGPDDPPIVTAPAWSITLPSLNLRR